MLGPGINLKWPWPFDTIERFKPGEIRTLVLGPERDPERSLEAEAGREIADANQDGIISKKERARFLKRPFLWMDPDVKDYEREKKRWIYGPHHSFNMMQAHGEKCCGEK